MGDARAARYPRRVTPVRAWLDTALSWLSGIGADPLDDDETRRRKALLVLIAVLILPVSIVWATLYLTFGAWTGGVAALYAVISVASIVLFARTRDFAMFLRVQLVAILLAPTLSTIPIGGFLPSGGVGFWGVLAPIGALVFTGVRSGIRWYVAFVVVFLASGAIGAVLDNPSPLPVWFSATMLALNVTVGGTIVFTLLALFASQRAEALHALNEEHQRAEGLLLSILPGPIAERLKSQPQTIADGFSAASVLFADVVNFTPRTEQMAPAEVVQMLDRLFGEFDTLAERYELEKIKTIGDSYMVAAGVPNPRPDHATAIAALALDMVEATGPGGAVGDLGLDLRVGINSGPVMAGVIGRKKFLYDLWGDAVNTASRMESEGTPDRIQITRATYELIGDEFDCQPRGTVPVKGKGDMETWYLIGRRI